jgi:hypothetical protein
MPGLVSTMVGDHMGTPGVVSFFALFLLLSKNAKFRRQILNCWQSVVVVRQNRIKTSIRNVGPLSAVYTALWWSDPQNPKNGSKNGVSGRYGRGQFIHIFFGFLKFFSSIDFQRCGNTD